MDRYAYRIFAEFYDPDDGNIKEVETYEEDFTSYQEAVVAGQKKLLECQQRSPSKYKVTYTLDIYRLVNGCWDYYYFEDTS